MTIRGVPRPRRAIARAAASSIVDVEDPRRAVDDRGQLVVLVEVEPVGRPEAVTERRADPPRPRRRADDRERLQAEPEAPRRRPLADHHVERVVLHRRVEDLLDRPVEAVDLVDEQDVALVERGQDRGEVAGPLDRRAARVADVDLELAGDDRRERRLAEAGRAVEEDVVGGLSPALRRREQHRQVGLDLALADVLVERSRPEGALDDAVAVVDQVRREDPGEVVGHRWRAVPRAVAFSTYVRRRPAAVARTPPIQVGVRAYCGHAPVAPLRVRPPRAHRPRPERPDDDRRRWRRWPSATTCRRSSSSRSWRRSSTAASSGRRSARTAATRWPTTRRRSRSGGSSGCSTARSLRCPASSLRYYGTCSCPDEATCSLRDVMLDVRDAMLAILDKQTLADLAARPGRASIDPRGHPRRRARRPPSLSRRRSPRRQRVTPGSERVLPADERIESVVATTARGASTDDRLRPLQPATRFAVVRRVRPRHLAVPARHDVPDGRPALRLAQGRCSSSTPAPLLRGDRPAARRAGRLAGDAARVPAYGRYLEESGVDVASAVPARDPAAPARDRQEVLRRPLRPARALRRRRGPLPRHDDRRVERLDRDAVQLDPRPHASARSPIATSGSSPATRSGPRRSSRSTRSRWAPGRPAST